MENINRHPGIDFQAAYTQVGELNDGKFSTFCETSDCIERAVVQDLGLVALRNTGDRGRSIVATPEELDEFARGWMASRNGEVG